MSESLLAAPSSTTYDLTSSVSNSIDAPVYPEPTLPSLILIAVIFPPLTVATASAPVPSPNTKTLGAASYPDPALDIVKPVISPPLIVAVAVAPAPGPLLLLLYHQNLELTQNVVRSIHLFDMNSFLLLLLLHCVVLKQ